MIEFPEAVTIGGQVDKTLVGEVITEVLPPTHKHKFTFFNGDPKTYGELLKGKRILAARGKGIFVDMALEGGFFLSISDGINMKYGHGNAKIPDKYQLLIMLGNEAFITFTTSMYGGIHTFKDSFDNKYHTSSMESLSPLDDAFNEAYFERLIAAGKKNISVKALLATEQRIPGVGNGVLQDILFNAGLHPKYKIFSLSDTDKSNLFRSLKDGLKAMTEGGGRDTETDFFGNRGGYKTVLSKNTFGTPCPRCGAEIRKEAYLGGSVYYCTSCQKL